MANMKKTLSDMSVTVTGRKKIESRYTPEQLKILKWEAVCLEEASQAYPRKKTKKEYTEKAYTDLLKKHYTNPDTSMKTLINSYKASLKDPLYRNNHVYNLTVELGYDYDARREYRERNAGLQKPQLKPNPQSGSNPSNSFLGKMMNIFSAGR